MEISVLNANSVEPDQTPRSAASDLGLHCLSLHYLETSHLWDGRHKLIKKCGYEFWCRIFNIITVDW